MNKLLSFFGTLLFCLYIVYAWFFFFNCNTQVHRAGARNPDRLELPFFSFKFIAFRYVQILTKVVDEMNRFMDRYTCFVHAVLNTPYIVRD